MRHEELHLVGQDAPVAQDEVFPEAGDVGRVEQRHTGLLGGTTALAVVAGAAISPPSRSYQFDSPFRNNERNGKVKIPALQASYPRLLVYDLRICWPPSPLMP